MATRNTKMERKIKEMTECSICTEPFTDPRALPCLHTFCYRCVLNLVKKKTLEDANCTYLCPLCRNEFEIPAQGLMALPKNFYLDTLLDIDGYYGGGAASGESSCNYSAPTMCDVCTELGTRPAIRCHATWNCSDCSQNLCEHCFQCHKRISSTVQHRLVSASMVGTAGSGRIRERFCERHIQKMIELWCVDCRTPTCMLCYVSDHNGHQCDIYRAPRGRMLQSTFRSPASPAVIPAYGGGAATVGGVTFLPAPTPSSGGGAAWTPANTARAGASVAVTGTSTGGAAGVGASTRGAVGAGASTGGPVRGGANTGGSVGAEGGASAAPAVSTSAVSSLGEFYTGFTGHCYRCGWQGHRAFECKENLSPMSPAAEEEDEEEEVEEEETASPPSIFGRLSRPTSEASSTGAQRAGLGSQTTWIESLSSSFQELHELLRSRKEAQAATLRQEEEEAEEASERSPSPPSWARTILQAAPAIKCNACGGAGHPSRFCRNKQQCRNCGCYGHTADDCTRETRETKCYECNLMGHVAQDCPTTPRCEM